ncbi:MAG: hypothetical protein UT58_C0012G0015 [Microgenomates group bacterium GW2011_GWC1_39_7b]|uniref:Toxin-antitoxin system, toxin component, RelE family n=3 Tax=Candidatus Woeseibacteriota TaxID=1752722 RepID=A0A0G0UXL4_9BACT|nr:MAG: hypothetical protein UT17_C0001G0045 [Candidatus Woesebacteria bacterium GW2011_GWB1_39_10]KKR26460.1 MAG: hypothetical protein UT58_C0012G0015 [Microgenomates group bacterium GW2011_GWC1_39_7b]KKR73981.1 MAG: hypothetical protein UU16_C0008G0011 [Candidatus Woesebacteria bacterium GW2011_GWA2_40_7]KKR92231.1 MAG: hypothetical protein UU42_C0002G0045 [Candidatus Woesebacteria bacterium GW2011_GWA1_41_13b]
MKVIYHPEVDKTIRDLSNKENSRVVKVVDFFESSKFLLDQKYLKKIMKGLWELRAGRYRLLFGISGGNAIVTRLFLKKTQKTPDREIKLAIKRLNEYEQ